MKFSERYISFISDRRVAVFSVIITSLVGAYISSIDNRISNALINMVTVQFSFSGNLFRSYLSVWSEDSILLFVKYLKADTVFALCYSITLSSVIAAMWLHLNALYQGSPLPRLSTLFFKTGITLPYLAAAFNVGEDLLLYAAARLGYISDPLIVTQSTLAVVKYLFIAASIISVFGILFLRRRKMKRG